jgi:5-methylcytosine-specific restriction endonuclease McrA
MPKRAPKKSVINQFKSSSNLAIQRRMRRKLLFQKQSGMCHWCKRTMKIRPFPSTNAPPDYATFEHLKPRSEGGTWHASNIVLACHRCNSARGSAIGPPAS